MYLTSQDDEFRAKRDDVLRVYYETPADEHIVCVDEKTGMQALERRYPDIAMPSRSAGPARIRVHPPRYALLDGRTRRATWVCPSGLHRASTTETRSSTCWNSLNSSIPTAGVISSWTTFRPAGHPRRQRLVPTSIRAGLGTSPPSTPPGSIRSSAGSQSSDVESSREARLPPPANSPIKSTITSSGTYKPTNPSTGLTALSLGALLAALQAGGTRGCP